MNELILAYIFGTTLLATGGIWMSQNRSPRQSTSSRPMRIICMSFFYCVLLTSGRLWAQQYVISTVAGGASLPTPVAALNASIGRPFGVATDARGNVYIADFLNSCVGRVSPAETITTIAGNGPDGDRRDGIPATSALLFHPIGVAIDDSGSLYIAEYDRSLIRKVLPNGIISTVAGG